MRTVVAAVVAAVVALLPGAARADSPAPSASPSPSPSSPSPSPSPSASPSPSGPSSVPEVYPVPPSGSYVLAGRGYGHGHGLSQWGAYGAAKVDGLSSNQILHFYYPHTTLATMSTTQTIRVLLTAAETPSTGYLELAPASGLAVTPASGTPTVLPTTATTGEPITHWRIRKSAGSLVLKARWAGAWHLQPPSLGSSATVSDPAALVAVVEPGSGASGGPTKTVRYRGDLVAQLQSGSVQAVDDLPVEAYVSSVVPSEMPTGWPAAALQAQAVAARTYAWRAIGSPKASWYDVDGDSRDQGYGGYAAETPSSDAAVTATAGEVAVDSTGTPIFAQYGSADGGWTAAGGEPYLPAKHDPYDGAVPNSAHAWKTSLSATAIAAAYPTIGTLQRLVITGRDGHGLWGGRVTAMSVVGSAATVTVTGAQFQAALGLRSPWFRPAPAAAPSASPSPSPASS